MAGNLSEKLVNGPLAGKLILISVPYCCVTALFWFESAGISNLRPSPPPHISNNLNVEFLIVINTCVPFPLMAQNDPWNVFL